MRNGPECSMISILEYETIWTILSRKASSYRILPMEIDSRITRSIHYTKNSSKKYVKMDDDVSPRILSKIVTNSPTKNSSMEEKNADSGIKRMPPRVKNLHHNRCRFCLVKSSYPKKLFILAKRPLLCV